MTDYTLERSTYLPASDNELASFTEEGHAKVLESLQELDIASTGRKPRKKAVPRKLSVKTPTRNVVFDTADTVDEFEEKLPEKEDLSSSLKLPKQEVFIEPQESNFSYFGQNNPWTFFGNSLGLSRQPEPVDNDTESVKSTSVKDEPTSRSSSQKGKKKVQDTDDADKDTEEAQKRRVLHQINRYKEKFNIKLRRQPTDRMSLKELNEIKSQTISQISEKEGSRILKSFYCQGLNAVDQVSSTLGYNQLRGLGQVGTAIAHDEENEILWEQLAIEFEDYLHVSPQKKLVLLTAQILATTVRINTDPQFASQIAKDMSEAEERLRKEFADA